MIQKAAFLEAAVLNPSALLEFFLVDMTVLRGPVAYFHAGVYPPGHASQYGDIIWQGQPYAACPLMTEGFAFTTIGTQPRPKLNIANITGAISALCLQFADLCGSKVIRKRTFAKFLDGMPGANPNAYLPDETWFIEQKLGEDREQVSFQLATAFDVDGISLPNRQVTADVCTWSYRGDGCGFIQQICIDDIEGRFNLRALPQVNRGDWNPSASYVW